MAVAVFRRKRKEQAKENADLIRFMEEHQLSFTLARRIQKYIRHSTVLPSKVHRIHASSVPQLKQLSPALKEELLFEVYRPVLSCHPFLNHILQLDQVFVSSICATTMSQQSLMPQTPVFRLGDEGKAMYFVVGGEMCYFNKVHTAPAYALLKDWTGKIEPGCWASEFALFLVWQHRGLMTTLQAASELVSIDVALFLSVLQQSPQISELCRDYAKAILEDVQSGYVEVTDLPMAPEKALSHIDRATNMVDRATERSCWSAAANAVICEPMDHGQDRSKAR